MQNANLGTTYHVQYAANPPAFSLDDNAADWHDIPALKINHFHPDSSDHQPATQARICYDNRGLYLHYHVQDNYIIAQHKQHQQQVCEDSCVEFFVQPVPCLPQPDGRLARGYFNFEMNCIGTILLHYNTIPRKQSIAITNTWLDKIECRTTFTSSISIEISAPTTWQVQLFIPFTLFEAYLGPLGTQHPVNNPGAGVTWLANLTKCADESSHPHWATWSPIGTKLDFHQPDTFGFITFDPPNHTAT